MEGSRVTVTSADGTTRPATPNEERAFEAHMAEYQRWEYDWSDLVAGLRSRGLDAAMWNTGGGCMCVQITVSPTKYLLIGDDYEFAGSLPDRGEWSERSENNGLSVGFYDDEDEALSCGGLQLVFRRSKFDDEPTYIRELVDGIAAALNFGAGS